MLHFKNNIILLFRVFWHVLYHYYTTDIFVIINTYVVLLEKRIILVSHQTLFVLFVNLLALSDFSLRYCGVSHTFIKIVHKKNRFYFFLTLILNSILLNGAWAKEMNQFELAIYNN
jgi:hypothetical protein